MAQSKTSARRIASAQKRLKVVELRLMGARLSEIGKVLGFSPQRAHKILMEEQERLAMMTLGAMDAWRRLQLERLEMAVLAVSTKVKKGDPKAIDLWIKLSKNERELLGLDAPVKFAPTDPDGKPLQHDLSKLSSEELVAMAALVAKTMESPKG
jgi:hypothetical protein